MQHDSVAPLPARARKPVSRVTQGSLFTLPRGPFSSCRYQASPTIDAEVAARSLLAGQSTAIPKTADGAVEMIRQLKITRDTAMKARTTAVSPQ